MQLIVSLPESVVTCKIGLQACFWKVILIALTEAGNVVLTVDMSAPWAGDLG